jgi:putative FmdB family regulatory protein
MPTYVLECRECKKIWDELCSFEQIRLIYCPTCGADKPDQKITGPRAVIFKEPKGTSFEDKFDYVAQWNMDNAKEIRRQAEANSHMGRSPYNKIDDLTTDKYFGEVQ